MIFCFGSAAVAVFQTTGPAKAISSLAPMATASIRTGSVMEMMTAQIMETKMDVVRRGEMLIEKHCLKVSFRTCVSYFPCEKLSV